FQAEDGIRDFSRDWSSDVCSSDLRLEYSVESLRVAAAWAKDDAPIEVITRLAKHAGLSAAPGKVEKEQFSSWRLPAVVQFRNGRSEERRVGKECRSRWASE